MAKVVIEDVSKIYPGGVKAVDNANLVIEDREFVVLVGPSGCGKSTTLRMVAGLEEISAGSIYIDDRKVNDVPPKDRDIAMVFQNYALYPHMTVYKNMAFGLKLRKYPKSEIDNRVREAAQILGITDEQLERKPKALSGGQRQRVAVGRAIVRKPKAFLFDEPLSNLDAKMRVQMRAEISKLHNQLQSTMIYVTHDQVEAMTMGDRIVVMKDGLIQQVADPISLYDHPVNIFVAGFIGSPPMNFFPGTIEQRNGGLCFTEEVSGEGMAFSLPLNDRLASKLDGHIGKPVVFGVRPEDVALEPNPNGAPQLVPARVDVVEPMGAELVVYLKSASSTFISRFDSHAQVTDGQELKLRFNLDKCHVFDRESENVIV